MRKDIYAALGERIRRRRKARGWTQVVMAEKLGMDRSYLADIERGKRNLTLRSLSLIAEGLKVSLSQLLSGL